MQVQQLPDLVRMLDLGSGVAEHPFSKAASGTASIVAIRTGDSATRRRTGVASITIGRLGDHVPLRSLAVCQEIGGQLAARGRP